MQATFVPLSNPENIAYQKLIQGLCKSIRVQL